MSSSPLFAALALEELAMRETDEAEHTPNFDLVERKTGFLTAVG